MGRRKSVLIFLVLLGSVLSGCKPGGGMGGGGDGGGGGPMQGQGCRCNKNGEPLDEQAQNDQQNLGNFQGGNVPTPDNSVIGGSVGNNPFAQVPVDPGSAILPPGDSQIIPDGTNANLEGIPGLENTIPGGDGSGIFAKVGDPSLTGEPRDPASSATGLEENLAARQIQAQGTGAH